MGAVSGSDRPRVRRGDTAGAYHVASQLVEQLRDAVGALAYRYELLAHGCASGPPVLSGTTPARSRCHFWPTS